MDRQMAKQTLEQTAHANLLAPGWKGNKVNPFNILIFLILYFNCLSLYSSLMVLLLWGLLVMVSMKEILSYASQ